MSNCMIVRRGRSKKLQAKTVTPSKSQQVVTPDSGYDGLSQVTVNGDNDLVASKIKKGVNIFNVTGTYEGEGFDANGAVLKVITSTGCTVLVTGTGYSKTHQQADGFPRVDDANVTEHFFSIPASAFGTITVKATNTYGDNTKTLTVDTAGKVYEQLCGGINIILNSTFGLQEGYSWTRTSGNSVYNGTYKRIEYVSGNSSGGFLEPDVPVTAFDTLTVESTAFSAGLESHLITQGVTICSISGAGEKSAQITDKHYATATFGASSFQYITKIILT